MRTLLEIAHLDVWQPADEFELLWAWRAAVERRDGCSALLLPELIGMPDRSVFVDEDPGKGAYIVADCAGPTHVTLIATGVQLGDALAAQRILRSRGIRARVVSAPCWSVFERQPLHYRTRVLPDETPHVYAHELAAGCLGQRADPGGEHREHRATTQALVDAVAARLADAPTLARQTLSTRGAM